jgi:hypothetical protein
MLAVAPYLAPWVPRSVRARVSSIVYTPNDQNLISAPVYDIHALKPCVVPFLCWIFATTQPPHSCALIATFTLDEPKYGIPCEHRRARAPTDLLRVQHAGTGHKLQKGHRDTRTYFFE